MVTVLFASEVSTLSTTTFELLVFRFTAKNRRLIAAQPPVSPRGAPSAGFVARQVPLPPPLRLPPFRRVDPRRRDSRSYKESRCWFSSQRPALQSA